jgi:hypothetical protein
MASPDRQRASQGRTTVEVKNWVIAATTEHQIALQRLIVRFLLWAYGFLLVVTMGIFVLQGFRLCGFQLDNGLMKWLGGATVGEIGGLLTLTFGAVFKKLKD